ncbi:MAG: DUF3078 domain-containing protein [Bacteroidetes bacterium]|nr:DUF3078 domain-containing protein [Bacteroidota bacterium]
MKRYSLTMALLCVLLSQNVIAQVEPKATTDLLGGVKALKADSIAWKLKATIGAGVTTVNVSNWTGGGQDAVSIRGLFLGSADYADEKFSWDNDLDIGYGLTKLGTSGYRKSDDRIIFTSKASHAYSDNFRLTGFLDARTQFYIGYNYDQLDSAGNPTKTSNFMAPGYLTGAIGGEFTPGEILRVLVAPIATRGIFVTDPDLYNAGAFGVDPGKQSKIDLGGLLNVEFNWQIMENVRWKTRFNGFCRYSAPDLWVVTIENGVFFKVNSLLSVALLTDVFYDDRVPVLRDNGTTGPATQLRNQFLLNFTYTLQNYEDPK